MDGSPLRLPHDPGVKNHRVKDIYTPSSGMDTHAVAAAAPGLLARPAGAHHQAGPASQHTGGSRQPATRRPGGGSSSTSTRRSSSTRANRPRRPRRCSDADADQRRPDAPCRLLRRRWGHCRRQPPHIPEEAQSRLHPSAVRENPHAPLACDAAGAAGRAEETAPAAGVCPSGHAASFSSQRRIPARHVRRRVVRKCGCFGGGAAPR